MAVKSVKNNVGNIFSDGYDIFDQLDFELNPYNKRDWDNYQVEASWERVPNDEETGEPEFQTQKGFYLKLTCPNSERAENLLHSILYRDEDDFNDISIHINNPILTSDKKTGEELTDKSCYVIYAGNSRMMLLQNLFDAITTLVDSDTGFTLDDINLGFSKLNHDIDASITVETLYSEQIRDNTSVALTTLEQGEAINEYFAIVEEKFPNVSKTAKVNKVATAFGIKFPYVYDWIRFFQEYPEWFQNLAAEGVAVDTLRLIFQAFKAVNKDGQDLTLKDVYDQISGWATLNNNGKITRGVVNEWKANALTPANVPSEGETSETSEGETSEGAEVEKAPKTLATMPDIQLDDLTENIALLQTTGNELIVKASEVIENLNIMDYDEPEGIKILKVLDRLVAVVEGTMTSADKQALADQKEKERLEKEAAKEAAKAEKLAAKAAKEDPNVDFDPEEQIEVGVTV